MQDEEWENEWPMLNMKGEEQIWKFVQPKGIYLQKEDGSIVVSLDCSCDWEHKSTGLKITFLNGDNLNYIGGH